MKLKTALLAAAIGLATMPFAAQAQMRALSDPVVPHPDPESLFTSSDPLLNRNKQAALHIQRNLLKCSEWSRAGEWLTDAYIQHNPVAASGLEGVMYYFTQVAKREPLDPCPALSAEDPNGVVAVQAEGDYVTILTRRIVPYADDPSQSLHHHLVRYLALRRRQGRRALGPGHPAHHRAAAGCHADARGCRAATCRPQRDRRADVELCPCDRYLGCRRLCRSLHPGWCLRANQGA